MDSQYSRIRNRFRGSKKKGKYDVFISSHPEEYGLSDRYPSAVVVTEKTEAEKVVEAHPASNYEASVRIAKNLQKEYHTR